MKPIVYEIKRTLTSRFVIIMMIAIVGLSALIAYESASTSESSSVSSTPDVSYGYFLNGNNLTMVGYAYDSYGNPVSGVNVYYQYNGSDYHAVSSSKGYANSTFKVEKSQQIPIGTNYSYTQFGIRVWTQTIQYIVNYNLQYSGLEVPSAVVDPTNTSNLGFLILYVGHNGNLSPPLNIVIGAAYRSSPFPESFNYTYSYNYSSFSVAKIFPPITKSNWNMSFYIQAKTTGGKQVMIYSGTGSAGLLPETGFIRLSVYSPMTESKLQDMVYGGISGILVLFIPILAIFTAYLTYGKDRTSGVIESVLKRPVTRGELITTRFLSNALAIFVADSLAMIVTDLIYQHYLKMYFTPIFVTQLIWTYLVEGVAFLAIVYLISHVVKSQGALLGAAIGVFVVMDLFWQAIPFAVISALGIPYGSSTYVSTKIIFDYISPSGYSDLMQSLATGMLGVFGGVSINPATYGITPVALTVAGVLWMIVPFGIAYLLARYRD